MASRIESHRHAKADEDMTAGRDPRPAPASRRGALLAAAGGALAALLLWLAVTVPLALRLMHIDPVAPVARVEPPLPLHDAGRPTVAVLLSQAGTEVTDFLAPFAILSASGAFNVYAVAPGPEPAPTNGGLGIVPQLTFDAFDAAHPGGADVVIVPNVLDPDNRVIVDWVARQGGTGAVTASICEGARVLARTGLIDGRAATTHFAAVDELRQAFPAARWRNDVRYVADGPIVMSAGVSAAVEASLYLVGRFAGPATAERTARELGLRPGALEAPPPVLSFEDYATGFLNGAMVWPKREVRIPLRDGVDEIALAAALDAYSRTFAAVTASTAPGRLPQRSRHGLLLVPASPEEETGDPLLVEPGEASADQPPAFDRVLLDIAARFGGPTAALVADQLQYPADHLRLAAAPSRLWERLVVLAAILAAGAAVGLGIRAVRRRTGRAR